MIAYKDPYAVAEKVACGSPRCDWAGFEDVWTYPGTDRRDWQCPNCGTVQRIEDDR